MSMNRPIAWLAAIIVIGGAQQIASAQGVPTAPGSSHFWQFQPLLDPGYFEPDFQFFAPAEVNDFGGEEKPNTGLYVSFDRTYVNVTRPRDEFSFGSGNQGDFTWGNRMEVGYMTEEDKGWQAVLWHVDGPNEYFVNSESQIRFADPAGNVAQILIPVARDSVNALKMSSFELNRVWRQKPFHNQTQFEPYLGYRYINVKDYFQRDLFTEIDLTPPVGVGPEAFFNVTHRSTFENQMHGGQLGARFHRQRGHWLLSMDVKFFTLANFQTLRVIDEDVLVPNPDNLSIDGNAIIIINDGTGADLNRITRYERATQFCFGGEVRGEASYELTRDINLRFGFVFYDLGQGIGRGDLMRFNNQAVQMAGVTFGFTVNR